MTNQSPAWQEFLLIADHRFFIPLHTSSFRKKTCRMHGKLLLTESLSERLIRLSMFMELNKSMVEEMVTVMDEVVIRARRSG